MRGRNKAAAAAAAAAATAAVLLSCALPGGARGQSGASAAAPDPKAIVVRVGPLDATLEEFSREFHRAARSDTSSLTPDRAGVERFTRGFLSTLLLNAWAMQDTSFMTAEERSGIAEGVDQVLQESIRNELLPRYLKADDTVLRAVYERMKTQLDLATIKVPTYVELDSVRANLRKGVPFEEVARRWSKDLNSARVGGSVGWVDAKSFPVASQEILWSVPVGADTLVSETQFHAIYRVRGRRPGPPLQSFEQEKPGLLRAVSMLEMGKAGSAMHDDLMAAYHYRVDTGAAEWLRDFLHRETARARRKYDPAKDKPYAVLGQENEGPFWPEAPLKGAEAARPVAFIDGDTLPALEVIDELVFRPTLIWPLFESVGDVTELCDSALYDRVQVREAKRLRLGEKSDVQRKIVDKKRRGVWRAYRRERILPLVTPAEDEIKALYTKRIDQYRLPERRRFVLVNVPNKELAEKAAAGFRKGLVPSSIVRELDAPGIDFEVTPDTTAGWRRFGENPTIDRAIFGLEEGQTSDPLPDRGRYSVLRVEKISPPHTLAFEEVRQNLQYEIIAEREKKLIDEILGRARPLFQISVDKETIARMDIDPTPFRSRKPRARS